MLKHANIYQRIILGVVGLLALILLTCILLLSTPRERALAGPPDPAPPEGQRVTQEIEPAPPAPDLREWAPGVHFVERPSQQCLRPPSPTREEPLRIPQASIGWTEPMTETFEGDFPGEGWDVSGNTEYYWGKRNCDAYEGQYSAWSCGGGKAGHGLRCGANCPPNVDSWMVYGPFDLSNATQALLTFQMKADVGSDCVFFWGASLDDQCFRGYTFRGTTGGQWESRTLDLTSISGIGNLVGQRRVWVGFVFQSGPTGICQGVFVDDVTLRALMEWPVTRQLRNDNGCGEDYFRGWEPDYMAATVLKPHETDYPLRVRSVDFTLYAGFPNANQWARVKACAYEVAPDLSFTPKTPQCSGTTEVLGPFWPDWVSIELPSPLVVEDPNLVLAAVGYGRQTSNRTPSLLMDSTKSIPQNRNFYSRDGGRTWIEHYDWWAEPEAVGYNMIRATGQLPTPTPTPTSTNTPTPTPTNTPTPTSTATPTATPTATATPTSTATPTDTPTPAPTDTAVPASTATSTHTMTPTPTEPPERYSIHLPLVTRYWPPLPEIPTLYAISNPDGDGNYIVSWSSAALAQRYELHEDDDGGFNSPANRYTGGNTSYTVTNQRDGVWYYRVRACNSYGCSGWSNVESVGVRPSRLYATADATVIEGTASENFGSTVDMWVGYDHCKGGKRARSLVQFDVSAIAPGTQIAQATLSLYLVHSCDIGERTHKVKVYRTSDQWTESSVTWNDQPGRADSYASVSIPSRTWGRYSFDVTDLVRGWVNGNFPNYGLMVRGPESSGDDSARLGFYTREVIGTTYDPYIQITYAGMTAAPEGEAALMDISPNSPGYGTFIKDILDIVVTPWHTLYHESEAFSSD